MIIAAEYRQARDLVFAFKYGRNRAVGRSLAHALVRTAVPNPYAKRADCVAAVPLHHLRERERAFNQSELLARSLAGALGKPLVSSALLRTKATSRQATIQSPTERRANVQGAFSVRDPGVFRGKHVLLVDDIVTTGATISEVARVVLCAGGASVSAAAVAHPFLTVPQVEFDPQEWTV